MVTGQRGAVTGRRGAVAGRPLDVQARTHARRPRTIASGEPSHGAPASKPAGNRIERNKM
jgi:hypothetical protein